MKVRIFSKGKGWYVSATNYKDKSDKAYMNVHFGNHDEPIPNNVNIETSGFDFTDIDVLEAKFNSFNKKISMTVFKYEPILNGELKQNTNVYRSDVPTTIDEDDVPW